MRKSFVFGVLPIIMLLTMGNSGCEDSDAKQTRMQEQGLMNATNAIGLPDITNYRERRILKMIYELRDTEIATVTYIVDMNGKNHKVCDSIGYGIPAATQYTSPTKVYSVSLGLPQADPNGLFSPASAEGTWVLCLNPQTKQTVPLYIEPRVIVSPFPLDLK